MFAFVSHCGRDCASACDCDCCVERCDLPRYLCFLIRDIKAHCVHPLDAVRMWSVSTKRIQQTNEQQSCLRCSRVPFSLSASLPLSLSFRFSLPAALAVDAACGAAVGAGYTLIVLRGFLPVSLLQCPSFTGGTQHGSDRRDAGQCCNLGISVVVSSLLLRRSFRGSTQHKNGSEFGEPDEAKIWELPLFSHSQSVLSFNGISRRKYTGLYQVLGRRAIRYTGKNLL